jgi:hypothetical protein
MNQQESDSGQPVSPPGAGAPSRLMSKQMSIYYTNCSMAATSPRDISLFFGRLVPTADDKGNQSLAELYEHQIYMTFEQAEDLARMLIQTTQIARARRTEAASRQTAPDA